MCEIAIYDPAESSIDAQQALAESMFEDNSDGIGVTAIYRGDGEIATPTFKAYVPQWDAVRGFLAGHQYAWRLAIHCRLGTHGEKGVDQTHPISVECPECDVSQVMHNGMVSANGYHADRLEGRGHAFNTAVDSETIAHYHGELPETLDDVEAPPITGSLAYVLVGDDRVLIRSDYRYYVDGSAKMMHRQRVEDPDAKRGRYWVLVTPETVDMAPVKSTGGRTAGVTHRSVYTGSTGGTARVVGSSQTRTGADDGDDDDDDGDDGDYYLPRSRTKSGKYCPDCGDEMPETTVSGWYHCVTCGESVAERHAKDAPFDAGYSGRSDTGDDGDRERGILRRIKDRARW